MLANGALLWFLWLCAAGDLYGELTCALYEPFLQSSNISGDEE